MTEPTAPSPAIYFSGNSYRLNQEIKRYLTGSPYEGRDSGDYPVQRCSIPLEGCGDPAAEIHAYAYGDLVVLSPVMSNDHWYAHGCAVEDVEPFVSLRLVEGPYQKTEEYRIRHGIGTRAVAYGRTYDYRLNKETPGIPWNFVQIEAVVPKTGMSETGELALKRPASGAVQFLGDMTLQVTADFFGKNLVWTERLGDKGHPLSNLALHLKHGQVGEHDALAMWDAALCAHTRGELDTSGIKSVASRKAIAPNLERLRREAPLLHLFYRWLHDGRTRDKLKNNTLLAKFLVECGSDYDRLREELEAARGKALEVALGWYIENDDLTRAVCLSLPGAREYKQEKEAKADWKKREDKGAQAEGLGITPEQYPLLHAAVLEGKIPTTVFYQPSNKEPVNVEFSIWEKALARKGWGDVLYAIAANAASRNTYERDITPYIAFMFRLEKYLDRNTEGRKKWSCMPKFVNSQWELEMDEAGEEGTVKRRSALTPVADNETRTVTVPYAAMAIRGVHTTWCYSLNYHVFEEGMQDPISNGIVPSDVVEKLNGRDDYGLCFYTLTGTARNQGYPTFLIIFERRAKGTFVHFHRVHPKRTVDGVNTPACQLVERCYQYMAGNVPASEITAQQGDMIFLHKPEATDVDKKASVAEPEQVNEFESHRFVPPEGGSVSLYRSQAKSVGNRLGYIHTETGFAVRHPEHDDIEHIPAGWVEVRRCKSWEANPTAVWSFTID